MQEIINLLKEGNVAVFCGSGLSAESGIPTFRGKGGLWEKYDPALYATIQSVKVLFFTAPGKIKAFLLDFYEALLSTKPNYAHYALARLEEMGFLCGTITQNIDDLHAQAGASRIAEVHGNSYVFRCRACGYFLKKTQGQVREFLNMLEKISRRRAIMKSILDFMGRCPSCGRRLESGVVFFGQSLPEAEMSKSFSYINTARSLLCIGTSGVVYPAASFPLAAKQKGALLINVNPQSSALDEVCDFNVRNTAVNFFKEIMPVFETE